MRWRWYFCARRNTLRWLSRARKRRFARDAGILSKNVHCVTQATVTGFTDQLYVKQLMSKHRLVRAEHDEDADDLRSNAMGFAD